MIKMKAEVKYPLKILKSLPGNLTREFFSKIGLNCSGRSKFRIVFCDSENRELFSSDSENKRLVRLRKMMKDGAIKFELTMKMRRRGDENNATAGEDSNTSQEKEITRFADNKESVGISVASDKKFNLDQTSNETLNDRNFRLFEIPDSLKVFSVIECTRYNFPALDEINGIKNYVIEIWSAKCGDPNFCAAEFSYRVKDAQESTVLTQDAKDILCALKEYFGHLSSGESNANKSEVFFSSARSIGSINWSSTWSEQTSEEFHTDFIQGEVENVEFPSAQL